MLKNIFEVIKDKKIKVILDKEEIYIKNYNKIIDFKDNYLEIDCTKFLLKVTGKELLINEMMDNDVLITGIINKVELI